MWNQAAWDARAGEIARGFRVKRRNAITALLTGTSFAFFTARYVAPEPWKDVGIVVLSGLTLAGILAGVLYANAFEYVLHRFVLHRGEGFLDFRHARHHDTPGAPEEARYVTFATSPWVTILVFVLNGVPVVVFEYFLHVGIGPGVFLGFAIYFVLYEEIHWRTHFGGLPRWMSFARRHHLLHHRGFPGRYNVFLPIFDWLFHRRQWPWNRSNT